MPADYGISAAQSLSSDVNKVGPDGQTVETEVGVVSDKLPELTLEMDDEKIVKLADKWEKKWMGSSVRTEWLQQTKENEEYWLGKQFDTPQKESKRSMVDNLIFESLETFLPQATRRNPEPLVKLHSAEQTDEAREKYQTKVKDRLADLADENKIRLKLKKAARHWAIYQVGVGKIGWDLDRDLPILRIVRPKKIILDPEATIDEDGYTGGRIGEYRKLEASIVLGIIGEGEGTANARKAIKDLVGEDLGTDVQFIEWWTPQYMFWKLGEHILFKKKNPHWNYDTTEIDKTFDDFGKPMERKVESDGINHFPVPKMPFVFLSIFNLGDRPMDRTGLIQQNLSNQDLINKRNRQIDKNADSMNGGMVVSLERAGLTKEQASSVSRVLRKGGTVAIPAGAPREAVDRFPAQGLPQDVYNQLVDIRARMRDIFGVKGSSQAGLSSERTVRGKIVSRNLDTDRIGGGITEYLEQFADDVYNWFLQMLYVYDDAFQFVAGAQPPKLTISVKEGSLLPKDSTTIANQAIELANAQKMSTIDLYKRLEYPNPEELAANAWLEINAPQILFKDNPMVQEALGMMQQQEMQAAQIDVAEEAGKQIAQTGANVAEDVLSEVPTDGF